MNAADTADTAVRYARKSAEAVEAMAELMGLAAQGRVPECFLPPDLFAEVAASCGAKPEADTALRAFFEHDGVVFFTRAGAL